MIRFGDAWDYFRHQIESAGVERHSRPRRDGSGRRMRASAYGRAGTRGAAINAPTRYSWTSIIAKAVLALLLASVAFLASSRAYIGFAGDLPDANALAATHVPTDTMIYASDGKTLIADVHRGGHQHYDEALANMGPLLPNATIAIEDANFYHEPGIDVTGIARAAWIDWREHRPVQGASTITQQLVKLRLIGNEPSLTRKIKEAVLALQVERSFSKQQILEMYLNTVFYGNDAYGTAAASKIYFHTTTKQLDLAQASMLAGIPQNPTYNNPFANWQGAKARQLQVLNAMVKTHMVTRLEADKAYAEDISPPKHMFRPVTTPLVPGFASYVRSVLSSQYGDTETYEGGLRVLTTLDYGLQKIAQRDLTQNLAENGWHGFSQEAMTSIDPHTGAILAMVGSIPNQPGGNYNFAVWPPRSPGSSMKIYTYTAAIASGKWTMVTPVADTPLTIPGQYTGDGKPYQPKNYDQGYHGVCQLQQCLGNSYNIPAVKVELSIGVPAVVQLARSMGAPPWIALNGSWSNDAPVNDYGFSTTLGGYYETPLQQATGVSVLAAQGVLHQPYAIQRVTTPDGVDVFKANPSANAKRVLDARVAYIMAQIMSDNSNRINAFGSTSTYLIQPNRKIASKTGTAENFRDAYTVGFTPAIATAIWAGNADYHAMLEGQDAVVDTGPAYHNYMFDATNYLHEPGSDWFQEPPGLIDAIVGGKLQWFLPGTSPYQPAPPLPSFVQTSGASGSYCYTYKKRTYCRSTSPTPGND